MFDWYPSVEPILIRAQLVLAMMGMGATLRPKDFADVFKHPVGVVLGAALQWIMVPGLAYAFTLLFGLAPGWAVGLILISVAPGGALSNLYTFLARAHTPLSISVTLVATIGCVFTIPFLLQLLTASHMPGGITVPASRVFKDMALYLVLPLIVGMGVLQLVPRRAKLISAICIYGSLALVLTIGLGSMGAGRIKVAQYGWKPPLVILLYSVVIHLAAAEISRLFRRYDDETTALAIEVGIRNCGVSMLFVPSFFVGQPEQGHALYSLLFFAGISPLIPLATALRNRIGRSPVWFRAPRRRPGGVPGRVNLDEDTAPSA